MTTQQFDELILAMLVIFILGFFIGEPGTEKAMRQVPPLAGEGGKQ